LSTTSIQTFTEFENPSKRPGLTVIVMGNTPFDCHVPRASVTVGVMLGSHCADAGGAAMIMSIAATSDAHNPSR
jgi:hypothetical protein